MKKKRQELETLENQLSKVQIIDSDAKILNQDELNSSLSLLSSEDARVQTI